MDNNIENKPPIRIKLNNINTNQNIEETIEQTELIEENEFEDENAVEDINSINIENNNTFTSENRRVKSPELRDEIRQIMINDDKEKSKNCCVKSTIFLFVIPHIIMVICATTGYIFKESNNAVAYFEMLLLFGGSAISYIVSCIFSIKANMLDKTNTWAKLLLIAQVIILLITIVIISAFAKCVYSCSQSGW